MATITRQRRTRAHGAVLELVRQRPGITIKEIVDALSPRVDNAEVLIAALLDSGDLGVHPTAKSAGPFTEAWGPEPNEEELAEARRVGEGAEQAALALALDGALSRELAADRIGVTPQAVSERVKAGKLVGLRRGREWRFPAWQFADDGTLPALGELIGAWPGTPLALCAWAVTRSADLDGLTPAQALARRGGPERVLEAAHALGASAW
jgi:hypothetical protein